MYVAADTSRMEAAARWRPVGQVLVENGSITREQLEAALAEQRSNGRKIGDILVNSGAITWLTLAHAIAEQAADLGVPRAPAPTAVPTEREVAPTANGFPAGEGRLAEVEALLKERQRAYLELVSITETLRAAVEKLQHDVVQRDEEIARLRAASS
jgi:hypothetical protein